MSLSYDFSCLSKASIFYPTMATSLHQAEILAQPCYEGQQSEELCIFVTGPHTLPSSPPGTGFQYNFLHWLPGRSLSMEQACTQHTGHWSKEWKSSIHAQRPVHIHTHMHSLGSYSTHWSYRILQYFVVKEDKCPMSPQYCPHSSGGVRSLKTLPANSATWTVELNTESLDNLSGTVWKGLQRVHLILSGAAARLWDPSGLQMYVSIAPQTYRRVSIA